MDLIEHLADAELIKLGDGWSCYRPSKHWFNGIRRTGAADRGVAKITAAVYQNGQSLDKQWKAA